MRRGKTAGITDLNEHPTDTITVTRRLDKAMLATAYWYLTIPLIIFLIGWVRPCVAFPGALILAFCCFRCIREHSAESTEFLSVLKPRRIHVVLVIVSVLAWVLLSGLGGYTYQNADHNYRNATLRDLVCCHWPVVETPSTPDSRALMGDKPVALVYYIGHWLPAASIGKLFGLRSAQHALFIWSLLGCALSLYFFFRYVKKISFGAALIFMGFSGLDVIGVIVMKKHIPTPCEHLEWWATIFQYSSITTLLYWVFNQTIAVWLAVMLMLNQKTPRNLLFLFATTNAVSVFPAIGLVPIVLCQCYMLSRKRMSNSEPNKHNRRITLFGKNEYRHPAFRWITVQNVLAPIVTCLVFLPYYMATKGGAPSGGWYFSIVGFSARTLGLLLLFYLLEFGIYLAIIGHAFRREPLFLVTSACLILIPLYFSKVSNEFAMRASIPAVLVLMTYVARYFTLGRSQQKQYAKLALITVLAIGAVTPGIEVFRSIRHIRDWPCPADKFHSFEYTGSVSTPIRYPKYFEHYVGTDLDKSFFFTHLCKPANHDNR